MRYLSSRCPTHGNKKESKKGRVPSGGRKKSKDIMLVDFELGINPIQLSAVQPNPAQSTSLHSTPTLPSPLRSHLSYTLLYFSLLDPMNFHAIRPIPSHPIPSHPIQIQPESQTRTHCPYT
ncbi:hypothetical protein EYC80_006031 [Monilinia laxa]|uniref:Uncharacterized protein n=1 Tax=Monilinia laxa TaxID=61186 RepID=A0A5N6KG45_MONLA|nr:hypothetical protein EYC80_006031 [Monilinia laxa]